MARRVLSSQISPEAITPRFTVFDVSPVVECGRYPAKAVIGEIIPISATAFREGHDQLSVELLLTDPHGNSIGPFPMSTQGESDRYLANFTAASMGAWSFSITTWSDPLATWRHRAEIKIPAGLDTDLELGEGALLLEQVALSLKVDDEKTLAGAIATMRNTALPASVRYAAAVDAPVLKVLQAHPIRENACVHGPWPLRIERRRALVGSWYEFFPRSEGATLTPLKSGTFTSAAKGLPRIAKMGFDVVYLPPIHPIGEVNRKGPNNTLTPRKIDPGSPWAVGSVLGGHDSVHPDLGTLEDFTLFVVEAKKLNLEIALDLALQTAPDHPWVTSNPQWFTRRGDGSIAYAENPPKKYQDIYPLNFDTDPEGLYLEIERIVLFWIAAGVLIFRVDNPHTKPVWFWHRLISAINTQHPEVIFLAEAFTREPMMRALAEVGFQQSYTYFTWKNTKWELEEYFTEIAGPKAHYMRPNLFTNTPDILNAYLQSGMPAAFAIRATLAATLSPTYGIYSGYEIYEHVALHPGSEEYLDTEKFQLRPRDWDLAQGQGRSLAPHLTLLNEIRRNSPALQELRTLRFHPSDSPDVIAFSKRGGVNGEDVILVVCNTDPFNEHSTTVHWNMHELGLTWGDQFAVTDQVTGTTWRWSEHTFVKLSPFGEVAHIAKIISPVQPLTVFFESAFATKGTRS
jgi:starch synthase (maltosyl-transferring)